MKGQLIKGALAAVLGLSLVGGGTYAAFNDVEAVNAKVEAGTLDLAVSPKVVFNISNLKPGDMMDRNFTIMNKGSLNIEKVLMHTSYTVTKNNQPVDAALAKEYADQFYVYWFTTELQPILDGLGKSVSGLTDLTAANHSVDITSYLKPSWLLPMLRPDLPVGDKDHIIMGLRFKNDDEREKNSRLFKQNKFQGLKMEVKFDLEATQYKGEQR
ncbi:TasA family protein [Bacillus sp. 1P06AnD]|uniref:TasA family protein n=1 Tax=Bacillus sp. 1P06AnD TaxID=3132208 RepID=UPI0039A01CA6